MRSIFFGHVPLFVALLLLGQFMPGYSQDTAPAGLSSSPGQSEPLRDVASEIARNLRKIDCPVRKCKILVANFVLPVGGTSAFGIRLADALSVQLTKTETPLAVVDRALFVDLLQRERLPAKVQNEEAVARWLARKLDADAVIIGETNKVSENSIELSARVLNSNEGKKKSLRVHAKLLIDPSKLDLSETDGLSQLPEFPGSFKGGKLYRVGVEGVGFPKCSYVPSPPYTPDARAMRFSGRVLVEGIITTSGKIEGLRIMSGAPGGLNDITLQTMQTWRCTTAEFDGRPVPALVSFEVTFRLY